MVDLTDVKGLFEKVTFKVGVVFHAFSRMPLSERVFTKVPSSLEITRFVSRAAKKRGRPAHFVGSRGLLPGHCVLLGPRAPWGKAEVRGNRKEGLDRELGLLHYAHFGPHRGLGGATPAEVYFGRSPSHLSAIPPPRGRLGEGSMDSPFRVDYLDGERLLPVLVRKAA